MRKRLLLIAVIAFFSYNFFLPPIPLEEQNKPLKVLRFDSDFLDISWKIQNLQINYSTTNGILYSHVIFDDCSFRQIEEGYEMIRISVLPKQFGGLSVENTPRRIKQLYFYYLKIPP